MKSLLGSGGSADSSVVSVKSKLLPDSKLKDRMEIMKAQDSGEFKDENDQIELERSRIAKQNVSQAELRRRGSLAQAQQAAKSK